MEKLTTFMGIAGIAGGFCFMLVQGINYLMKGSWVSYSVYGIVSNYGLGDTLAAHPDLMGFMEKFPLSVAIILIGTIFIWIASRLRNT